MWTSASWNARHTCTDAGTTMEWWALGVGLVRWDELNFYAGTPIRFLLVDYAEN